MKKVFIILFSLSLVIVLASCSKPNTPQSSTLPQSSNSQQSNDPPELKIEYDNETTNATVSSNSWNNIMSDYPAPSDLVDDVTPIKVKPGATLTLMFKNNPYSS